jgi:hypothetical protein
MNKLFKGLMLIIVISMLKLKSAKKISYFTFYLYFLITWSILFPLYFFHQNNLMGSILEFILFLLLFAHVIFFVKKILSQFRNKKYSHMLLSTLLLISTFLVLLIELIIVFGIGISGGATG